MKSRAVTTVDTGKVAAVWLLFATAGLITLAGVAFLAYSILNGVSFTVMRTSIPGELFGAVIAFLGVRYILSVRKLRARLYATHSRFSWRNFKAQ